MDNHQLPSQSGSGAGYAFISLFSLLFSWINFHMIDQAFTLLTRSASALAAAMAVRHYLIQHPIEFKEILNLFPKLFKKKK